MTYEDVINYIMASPENTNPNVLKDMLNDIKEKGIIIFGNNKDLEEIVTKLKKETPSGVSLI